MKYLVIANIFVWAGIFSYVMILAKENKEILNKINKIYTYSKEDRKNNE